MAKEKEVAKLSNEAKQSDQQRQELEGKFPQLKEIRESQEEALRKDVTNPGYLVGEMPTYGSD